jgi:hypothetical protein
MSLEIKSENTFAKVSRNKSIVCMKPKMSNEEKNIEKISVISSKKKRCRLNYIENMEALKQETLKMLASIQRVYTYYNDFFVICHEIPYHDIHKNPILIKLLKIGGVYLYKLDESSMKWVIWDYNEIEYDTMINNHLLFFYIPLKAQLNKFLRTYITRHINSITNKITRIDKLILKKKQEISEIISLQLYKISIEESYITNQIYNILWDVRSIIKPVLSVISPFVKKNKIIMPSQLKTCINVMCHLNQPRLLEKMKEYNMHKDLLNPKVQDIYVNISNIHRFFTLLESVVLYLYINKRMSIKEIHYKQYTNALQNFRETHKKLWKHILVESVQHIRTNVNFCEYVVEKIYSYL